MVSHDYQGSGASRGGGIGCSLWTLSLPTMNRLYFIGVAASKYADEFKPLVIPIPIPPRLFALPPFWGRRVSHALFVIF